MAARENRLLNEHLRVLPVLVALLAAVVATWASWPALVGTWVGMADYHHGTLLAAFVLVWLVRLGPSLPAPQERFSAVAAVLLLGALLAWLIALRALSSIGQQIMIPPILWLTVWLCCGLPTARRVAAPLACLYFAIPVWEMLLPVLQHMTVAVSETVLGWFGVPVSINGVFVTIPEGTFEVAEGCAGKRFLIVSLAVAGLFAGTSRMPPRRAAAFIAFTAALALLTNWLRVVIVIYSGHVSNMQSYFVAHEHISLGWAMFAVLVVIVCLLGRRLTDDVLPAPAPPAGNAAPGIATPRLHPLLATLLLLCVPFAGQLYTRYFPVPASAAPAMRLPVAAGEWRGPLAPDPRWMPTYPGASSWSRAAYRTAGGAEVQLYVAQYAAQREGAKLISFDNQLHSREWVLLRSGALESSSNAPPVRRAATLRLLTPRNQVWVVSYLYQVAGVVTASPVVAQLAYGTLSWTGALPSRLLAVAAPCGASCEGAERELADFWSAAGSDLLM